MSAAENSFAASGKQTLAATTLEVAVAPIADLPGASPNLPFALRLNSTRCRR
jgi:hypothetical protein